MTQALKQPKITVESSSAKKQLDVVFQSSSEQDGGETPVNDSPENPGFRKEFSDVSEDNPLLIEKYFELLRVIGQGSFGIIVAVRELATNEEFALKLTRWYELPNSHGIESLQTEAQILSLCDHPNIIKSFESLKETKVEQRELPDEECAGFGYLQHFDLQNQKAFLQDFDFDDFHFMALKLEVGLENLASFAARRSFEGNPLSEEESAKIMKSVLSAIKYLHEDKNMIHRDIKPQNILVFDYDDLSKVKLIDFGLATEFRY